MKRVYRFYKTFGKNYRFHFIIAFGFIVFVGFINMSHQFFFGKVIDLISIDLWDEAILYLIFYSLLFMLGQVMHSGINYIWIQLRTKFLYDIRIQMFSKVINARQTALDKMSMSDIIKRITYDTEELLSMIYHSLFYGIANTIKLFIGIIAISTIKIELGILCCLVIPFVTIIEQKIKKEIHTQQKEYHVYESELISQIHEFTNSFTDISRLSAVGFFSMRILDTTDKEKVAQSRVSRSENMHQIFIDFSLHITVIMLYFYSAMCIIRGEMTIGQIVIVISYFNTCKSLFRGLYQRRNTISKNMIAFERVVEILELEEERVGEKKKINTVETIEFRNVGFTYDGNRTIVNNISYALKKGIHLKIAGRNGEGKTTFIKLALGLYNLRKGEILINGNNIEDYNIRVLRDKIGVVWQKPYLIYGSIRENLLLGRENISEESICKVLTALGIKDVITELPQGLDTVIDPNNINLSTGQLKRLTMVRVLIRNPSILMLDEVTASLNKEMAMKVMKYIENEYKDHIIIYIAHDDKCSIENAEELHIN